MTIKMEANKEEENKGSEEAQQQDAPDTAVTAAVDESDRGETVQAEEEKQEAGDASHTQGGSHSEDSEDMPEESEPTQDGTATAVVQPDPRGAGQDTQSSQGHDERVDDDHQERDNGSGVGAEGNEQTPEKAEQPELQDNSGKTEEGGTSEQRPTAGEEPMVEIAEFPEATDSVDLREKSADVPESGNLPPQQIMLGDDSPQQMLDAMATASRARARSILEPSTAPINEAAAKALSDDDDIADDYDAVTTAGKAAMAQAPAGLEQLVRQQQHQQQQRQQQQHQHQQQQQQAEMHSGDTARVSQEGIKGEKQERDAPEETRHGTSLTVEPEKPTPLSPTTAAIRTIAAVKAAWILPPEVKRVIDKRRETGAEGADVSVVAHGSPGIAVEEVAEDRLQTYARRHGVESLRRRSASSSQSSQDELRSIRRLMKGGSWRTALKLTSNFLTRHGQGLGFSGQPTAALHTPDTLQMWYLRAILLCQLRMYDVAEKELDSFGTFDRADLFYEYYRDKQCYELAHGTMVPFGLRLLHAELPRRRGRTKEAIDRQFGLLHICNQLVARHTAAAERKNQQRERSSRESDSGGAGGTTHEQCGSGKEKGEEEGEDEDEDFMNTTEAVHVWKERQRHVLFAVGNALCTLQDYRLAARVFERMLLPATPRDAKLLSLLGRISLLAGDITAANRKFTRVAELVGESDRSQVLSNAALLELAKGDSNKAAQQFADAQRASARMDSALANNWAVMTLYSGNLQLAVRGAETSMRELSTLDETLIFNLASMYELQSSRDTTHKKEWIPRLLECVHDGFNMTVLKLREA